MNGSCNVDAKRFAATETGTRLKEMCGVDSTKFNAITALVYNPNTDSGFTKEFDDYRKTDDIAKDAMDFYQSKHFNVAYQTTKSKYSDIIQRFGYANTQAKVMANRVIANNILTFYISDVLKGKDDEHKENRANYYANRTIKFIAKQLATKVMKIRNIPSTKDNVLRVVNQLLGYNTIEGFESIDKDFQSLSVEDRNVLAVFKEMLTNKAKFFNAIYAGDSRLGLLRTKGDDSVDERFDEEGLTEDIFVNDDNQDLVDSSNLEYDVDTTTARWDDNSGMGSNFMNGIDDSVKLIMFTIPKLTSTAKVDGKYSYDRSNPLGTIDFIDGKKVIATIISQCSRDNLNSFIKSIKDIANNNKEMAGLIKLADTLEANKDFAYSFRRQFIRSIMPKTETRVESDRQVHAISSNKEANRSQSLRFSFQNNIKHTSIINLESTSLDAVNKINEYIKRYNVAVKTNNELRIQEMFSNITSTLTNALHVYYPDMDKNAVAAFIRSNKINGQINVIANINILISNLKDTASAGTLNQQYKKENEEAKRKYQIAFEEDSSAKLVIPHESIISKQSIASANELAKLLEPYSSIALQFNSRNVLGNQSSDIINSSMLTNLMNALNGTEMSTDAEGKLSPEALIQYGNYKFQGNQYNLSNILIEQRDANGKIIVYGLFKKVGDKYAPTDYAKQLISISLFNGAGNPNTGENVLYSGMSKGDYVYSGFANFFNTEKDYDGSTKEALSLANYFMRIPSDAPKNFIVRAARYAYHDTNYGDLFTIENNEEFENAITDELNNLPKTDKVPTESQLKQFIKVESRDDYNRMISDLRATRINRRKIMDYQILKDPNHKGSYKSGDNLTIGYVYTDELGNQDRYVLQGTAEFDSDNNIYITNAKPYHIGNEFTSDVRQNLVDKIRREANRTGKIGDVVINKQINVNHPLFQQYRNVFIQELTDMAHNINQWFVTDANGKIQEWQEGESTDHKAGEPKFKQGWGLDEESARKAYAVYEVGKGHKHFVEYNDKTKGLTFTGSLFRDDRFIITNDDGTTTNVAQDLMDKLFSSLYGGDKDAYIPFTSNGDKVEVNLTDEQNEEVTKMISDFITSYVNQQVEKFDDFKNLDVAGLINDQNVADFVLNTRLTYISFNDLFEGDTKFYKDTQTFLKRSKESQASGVPYGFCDYVSDYSSTSVAVEGAYLNDGEIQKRFANFKNPLDVKQMTKFRGITIKNTVRTSEQCKVDTEDVTGKLTDKDGSLVKDLVKNAGLTVEQARTLMKGFIKTTVNDAQSYITFEEWIRRVAGRGQLAKYLPLIEKIQNDEPLSSADIKEFVQVQKNFYYDQYFDPVTKKFVPRQIKNAEFVLVPRFIKGTQLEQVYNLMKDNHIDQLNTEETSKAGKARVLEIFNSKTGEVTQEHIDDFNAHADAYAEYYDYNHLYTQQETPQHMDAENKAGIQIMKKIIDNIPVNSPLYDKKQEFFRLYSANIKDSFNTLADEINIPRDENGNIKFNDDGTISGIDYKVFFSKLKEECMRLGLDSNMMDYVTLAEQAINPMTGRPNPNMPMILSNVITKLESVSQSVFNRNITRQKLPGFHAAQITNVGFKATKDQVSYSKELRYHPVTKEHPEGERYIEIMLPKSNFNFAKNEDGTYKDVDEVRDENGELVGGLLKQLQDAKLDTLIGYRIPTEGKQSVCVMKVVGFLDDAQGSTIVVPDDWVSQTGSDFDIDSVYGIQYSSYIDKHGNIRKQSYSEELDIYDYANYINRHLEKADKIKDKSVKAAFDALNKEIDEAFDKSRKELSEEETQAYNALSDETKELVKTAHNVFETQAVRNKETGKLTKDSYLKQLQFVADYIRTNKTNLDNADDNFISVHEDIVDAISNEYIDKRIAKSDRVKKILQDRIDRFNNKAKELGLMTYEEFLQQSPEEANTRNARNNKLLDDMIDILESNESLEENLSRSNFDDIIAARDKVINPVVKDIREARSPYDFLNQADYQEDVMSGAKLKAFSVTRDTFVSVCNTVRPTIDDKNVININYHYKDAKALKELINRFGKYNVKDLGNNKCRITHTRIGWSEDNKNVDGRILTAYTSQTTAHILDAVKEGAIPNVNDFTFAVYKTLPDIGSNYDTTCAFIMQPAISRIVDEYNANKSIYAEESSKPIENAIKKLAIELNIGVTEEDSVQKAIDKINSVFKTNYSLTENNNIILDYDDLAARINEEDGQINPPVERLMFDLNMLFAYNDINKLAQGISSLARVCNPDRFGAKQTIFATNKVFRDIETIVNVDNAKQYSVLNVEDKNGDIISFLEAIYPGLIVDNNGIKSYDLHHYMTESNDNDSKYRSLHCFLKYATATSTSINSMLFDTQSNFFKNIVYSLEDTFSDNTRQISEKEYADFQQYILSGVYNNTPAMRLSIKPMFNKDGKFTQFGLDNETDETAERQRIFGYNASTDIKFAVNDIINPTQKEIEVFAKLTPAQKVAWIQMNTEDAGIFSLCKVNLFNQYEARQTGQSRQTISFKDDTVDVETAYMMFDQATNSDNPLIKLAAIDMIKYAFVVENFKMRRNAINKFITNDSLKDDSLFGGVNLVNQILEDFNNFAGTYNVAEDYVRAHSDASFIYHKTESKIKKGKTFVNELSTNRKSRDLLRFDLSDTTDLTNSIAELQGELNVETDEEERKKIAKDIKDLTDRLNVLKRDRKNAIKYGIITDCSTKTLPNDFRSNNYVEIKTKKSKGKDYTSILYKIQFIGTTVYAYPINKLDENETSAVSLIKENNKFKPEAFYFEYINELEKNNGENLELEDLNNLASQYNLGIKYKKLRNKIVFDINHPDKYNQGAARDAINKIIAKYPLSNGKEFNIQSIYLDRYVGFNFGNQQHIVGTYIDAESGNEITIDTDFKFRKYSSNEISRLAALGINVAPNTIIVKEVPKVENKGVIVETNQIKHSSILDYSIDAYRDISRRANEGDYEARRQVRKLGEKGFEGKKAQFGNEEERVYGAINDYVKTKVAEVHTNLNQFFADEDGHYHSVVEAETIDYIRNNPMEQRRFLKTLLDARALITKYGDIVTVKVDKDKQSDETINYVKGIQESIKSLIDSSKLEQAETLFATDYLAKLSDNPMIQNNIISIFDGFHSTSWFDAWVGDLQDSGNAFVQVITKNVMADIRAKEMQAMKRVESFNKELDKIFADAKKDGVNLSFDDIIDADGKSIRPYSKKFESDYKEIYKDFKQAEANIIENPKAYILAKHKYDKFLLDHVNRKFVDDYYKEFYDNDEEMISKHLPIFEEYTKLRAQVSKINSGRINGVLDPSDEDKLKELQKKILELRSTFDYDRMEEKESFYGGYPGAKVNDKGEVIEITDEKKYRQARISNFVDCKALDDYLSRINEIRNKYNDSKIKKGFDEQLKRNLDIVETAEARDPYGRLRVPISQLEANEDYKKAKAWLANNAKWTVDSAIQEEIHEAYKVLQYKGDRNSAYKVAVKRLIQKGDLHYDEYGRIDGSVFSDEDQQKIKDEVERKYYNNKYSANSDRILISNAPEDDTIYPTEIYRRMSSNGIPNEEYQKIVKKINDILKPYYDVSTKHVETSQMTEEDLNKLYDVYQPLFAGVKKTIEGTNGKSVGWFIKNYVDLDAYNETAFNLERERAKAKGEKYYKAWERVNMMSIPKVDDKYQVVTDSEGNVVYDETKPKVPNRYLYSALKVDMDKYLKNKSSKKATALRQEMEDKTKAYNTIHKYLETVNTPYYEAELKKQRAKGDKEFKEWYDRNHVYNPFTHVYEPTTIWRKTQVIPKHDNGTWTAGYAQTELAPKPAYKNNNYKEGLGNIANYKKTSDTTYDTDKILNKHQQRLLDYINSVLTSLAKTESAKRYIAQGYMPMMAKGKEHDAKWWAAQFLEFLGYSDKLQNGRDPFYHIDYADDKTIDMPMLMQQLHNKDSVNIENIKKTKPNRISYKDEEEYNKAMTAYNARLEEAEKKNKEIHEALINRDYRTVLSNFITQAAHFNAIQDNKYMLFYGKEMIDRMEVYEKNIGWANLKRDGQRGAKDEINYLKQKDTRLQGQYENWIRRLIYNQFKESNANYTKVASVMQAFTSAKFMMLNITGGIGNVTVGESSIAGEYIAKEFFDKSDYLKGKEMWTNAAISFVRGVYSKDSTTLADAICKFFNVVDFDQLAGISDGNKLDAGTAFEKLRNFLYSPNAMGEHFMQNGAMFSMMFANRLVPVADNVNKGRIAYRAMNRYEYIAKCHEDAMKQILDGTELEEEFNNFISSIKEDANKLKEYVFGRRDFVTEFAYTRLTGKNSDKKKQFVAKKKELEKKAEIEFKKNSTIMEQLDLKDGKLAFKDGSILAELDANSQDKEVSDAYRLLGEFKGKVISVNKEIHGVYDRLGAAQVEKHWWGSLAMQYHKHMYPGILKHFRRQGYFNEERGAMTIGCGPALLDFLSLPIRKMKADRELNDKQVEALESLQTLFKGYVDLATNFKTNWNILPRYQRAAILRAMGNACGAVAAIAVALATRCIWDNKELEDSTTANLLLYEADSLASQAMMYTPPFIVTEAKKLYSSPIAAQTMPSDLIKAMGIIAEGLIEGDDYNWDYTSGRYAKENKLFVLTTRQIPIYRAYSNIAGLDKSNSYYKLGKNVLGFIPVDDIANTIR
jgi:hypothetical protein